MSVVVPAYNEEERLSGMLEEAVDFLTEEYGTKSQKTKKNGSADIRRRNVDNVSAGAATGWEIIIVSDGSKDRTVSTALEFAQKRVLSSKIPPGSIRVVELEANRGKGGAVTHGMRHVRGKYVVFADADGASKFGDLRALVAKAQELENKDEESRAVAVGSRAHLVGSEAVVKVSDSTEICYADMLMVLCSDLYSETRSCTRSISSYAYSRRLSLHELATHNADSSYSRGQLCHI
jgi:dolichyl-phosphate beta-glucosyltransferase